MRKAKYENRINNKNLRIEVRSVYEYYKDYRKFKYYFKELKIKSDIKEAIQLHYIYKRIKVINTSFIGF